MSPTRESRGFRWMSLVLLGWMLAAWPTAALGQEGGPLAPQTAPTQAVLPNLGASQELRERLDKMEGRLDWLTKQNEALLRENKVLAGMATSPFRKINNPGPQGVMIGAQSGTASTGVTSPEGVGTGGFGSAGAGAAFGLGGMGG